LGEGLGEGLGEAGVAGLGAWSEGWVVGCGLGGMRHVNMWQGVLWPLHVQIAPGTGERQQALCRRETALCLV